MNALSRKAEDTNSILVLVSDNQGIFHQLMSGKQEDIKKLDGNFMPTHLALECPYLPTKDAWRSKLV